MPVGRQQPRSRRSGRLSVDSVSSRDTQILYRNIRFIVGDAAVTVRLSRVPLRSVRCPEGWRICRDVLSIRMRFGFRNRARARSRVRAATNGNPKRAADSGCWFRAVDAGLGWLSLDSRNARPGSRTGLVGAVQSVCAGNEACGVRYSATRLNDSWMAQTRTAARRLPRRTLSGPASAFPNDDRRPRGGRATSQTATSQSATVRSPNARHSKWSLLPMAATRGLLALVVRLSPNSA